MHKVFASVILILAVCLWAGAEVRPSTELKITKGSPPTIVAMDSVCLQFDLVAPWVEIKQEALAFRRAVLQAPPAVCPPLPARSDDTCRIPRPSTHGPGGLHHEPHQPLTADLVLTALRE